MEKVTYQISNISCNHCVHTIKTELSDLEGVASVDGDKDTKEITVTFQQPATVEKIKSVLTEINYPVTQ